MEKESLRRIFNRQGRKIEDRPDLTPAAVLVPLFQKGEETHILLTKRTDRVEQHKGQISFPGGAFDYRDLDCLTTALRERAPRAAFVSVLEGGYDPGRVAAAAVRHAAALAA